MSDTDSTERNPAGSAAAPTPASPIGTRRKVVRGVKNGLTAGFQSSVLLKGLVIVAEIALLFVSLGLAFEPDDPGLWLSFGLGSLALFNFILFYQSDNGEEPGIIRETRSAAMRRAIAGSAVTTYLLLVALLAFNPTLQASAGSNIGCGPPSAEVMVVALPALVPADPDDGDADGGGADPAAGDAVEPATPGPGAAGADPVVVSTPADSCIGVSRDLINRLGIVVGTVAVFYFGTTTLEDLVREGRSKSGGGASGATDAD